SGAMRTFITMKTLDCEAQWWRPQPLDRSKYLVLLEGKNRIQASSPVPAIVRAKRDFVIVDRRLDSCEPKPETGSLDLGLRAYWPRPGLPLGGK
ncbi:MAG TPA: hypothetical protein VNN81_12680, partial [Bradyrhizobium sp.]|nr:hypothetical protein [Bradyrhizobium sp.]